MAFTTPQLYRIKAELGLNLLNVGADVYVGISRIFEDVVQQFIDAEIATTAATAVTATTLPVPVALTLSSAVGFAAGQRCIVDVDSRREAATVQSLVGAVATLQLKGAHSGTYPVTVEGPISIACDILAKIADVKSEMAQTFGTGALKKADEVEFYATGHSLFGTMGQQLMYWRDELASVLGVPNAWRRKSGGGASISLY